MFVCTYCKTENELKYSICPKCKHYNSMKPVEDENDENSQSSNTMVKTSTLGKKPVKSRVLTTFTVKDLKNGENQLTRHSTGLSEFDRILMGGMVDGQVVLIGAEPGFGKSTLCLSVLAHFAENMPVLYASGEESERQIASRAERMHVNNDNLHIVATKNVENTLKTADSLNVKALVVDSLQTMGSEAIVGSIGSVAQSKDAAYQYTEWAKQHGAMVILISQFTKNDDVAGSNMIAHIVDTILVGESSLDSPLKFLRSRKNRYGKTDEVGVFVHEDDGLHSVSNPAGYFIGEDTKPIQGSAVSFCRDGARLLPVEVNALVTKSVYPNPQRQVSGLDLNRSRILIAALGKYANMTDALSVADVFITTMSGLKVSDTSVDLAILAAVMSSVCGIEPAVRTAWVGEVALTGYIKGGTAFLESKIKEAERLGFERIVIPQAAFKQIAGKIKAKIEIVPINKIKDLKSLL